MIHHLSASSHLIAQSVHFLPHPPSPTLAPSKNLPANESTSFLPLPLSQSLTQLQQLKLPNPFKSSTERRTISRRFSRASTALLVQLAEKDEGLEPGRIELGDEVDLSSVDLDVDEGYQSISGLALTGFGEKVMGCLWTDYQLLVRLRSCPFLPTYHRMQL